MRRTRSAERPARPLADYLGEIAWALFIFNLILLAVSLLFASHLGWVSSFAVFLGFGMSITILLLLVVVVNVLLERLCRIWRRSADRPGR